MMESTIGGPVSGHHYSKYCCRCLSLDIHGSFGLSDGEKCYLPSPPAPRKMPPTASASQSFDTPMMIHPATMLSRAEPTRSPWYSPILTAFIQQVEPPTNPVWLIHTRLFQTCQALTKADHYMKVSPLVRWVNRDSTFSSRLFIHL